jgi:hypothetical protein
VQTCRPLAAPVVHRHPVVAVGWLGDGRSFWTVGEDGKLRRWPVPRPLEAAPARIAEGLEALTAARVDPGPAIAPLDREAWLARYRAWLEREGGFDGVFGPADAAAWHLARADDAEEDGDAAGALWHLGRAGEAWPVAARRALAHATEGRYELADAEDRRAARLASPLALDAWRDLAALRCRLVGRTEAAAWYQNRRPGAAPE